jgi:hypothetical protein
MKRFEDLTSKELLDLRNEIILNSIFVADYENSFGFNSKDVSYFFDGYLSFISELAEEDGNKDLEIGELCAKYDNEDNLWGWFNCYDDLSWVRNDNEDDE